MKISGGIPFSSAIFDNASGTPRYRQLYAYIRDQILAGNLPAGIRLPSTRAMASVCGIARNTVVAAYELLSDEQFVESLPGRGTVVRHVPVLAASSVPPLIKPAYPVRDPTLRVPFAVPDAEQFPWQEWQRILRNAMKRAGPATTRPPTIGDPKLRELVAAYLGAYRGLRCHPEQVIITTGAQQGLSLSAHVLHAFCNELFIEEPGYLGARRAFADTYRLHTLPVDAEGACFDALASRETPCVVYLTPSHQFPLGPTLSVERRVNILNRVQACNGWIVEDDYDAEYRYDGEPVTALAGIDNAQRVIYVGTFSKVLSPDIRLGYVVVPEALIGSFAKAKKWMDGACPVLMQMAVTDFIEQGHFHAHLRRMRVLYRSRRDRFLAILEEHRTPVSVQPRAAGMHMTLMLERDEDYDIAVEMARRGFETPALSVHYLDPGNARYGLLAGFTYANDADLDAYVGELTDVLR